ncbi:MAG: hypothetical protein IJU50_10875 [Lachnospiraceae bacterium]|nr:hypothetical protein [Lachnospiraceae bacterium]
MGLRKFFQILALASGLVCILWLAGAFLPGWVCWENKEDSFSIENRRLANGFPQYMGLQSAWAFMEGASGNFHLSLKHGLFQMQREGMDYFHSSPDWRVQDYLCTDLDHDGREEIILLVWKRGSYGSHKPTWVEKDEVGFSQHLFIYKPLERKLKPVWMSSKLGIEIQKMEEKDGSLLLTAPVGEKSLWSWRGWGLENLGLPP